MAVVWAAKHFHHYLYGHACTVYTDHEALKLLLNTPHPSGKLARWGMALQELDLTIEYRPGKRNARADALSRYPVSLLTSGQDEAHTDVVVAAVQVPSGVAVSGDECDEDTLIERQRGDCTLLPMINYLEKGEFPDDDKQARELVLSRPLYTVTDRLLYRVLPDKTLRVVPPVKDRRKLFMEEFSEHI